MSVVAVLGVITCQLHENQLDSAAGQLEFLHEVKDNISKSPVSHHTELGTLNALCHLFCCCLLYSAIFVSPSATLASRGIISWVLLDTYNAMLFFHSSLAPVYIRLTVSAISVLSSTVNCRCSLSHTSLTSQAPASISASCGLSGTHSC